MERFNPWDSKVWLRTGSVPTSCFTSNDFPETGYPKVLYDLHAAAFSTTDSIWTWSVFGMPVCPRYAIFAVETLFPPLSFSLALRLLAFYLPSPFCISCRPFVLRDWNFMKTKIKIAILITIYISVMARLGSNSDDKLDEMYKRFFRSFIMIRHIYGKAQEYAMRFYV